MAHRPCEMEESAYATARENAHQLIVDVAGPTVSKALFPTWKAIQILEFALPVFPSSELLRIDGAAPERVYRSSYPASWERWR